jgi:tetrahydrodipicolinate N-succinyltransferase
MGLGSGAVPAVNVAAVNGLQRTIEGLWDNRDSLDTEDRAAAAAVHEAIDLLDRGEVRVAEIFNGDVVVHQWLKKAILLLFQQAKLVAAEVGPFTYLDKIPLKSDFAPTASPYSETATDHSRTSETEAVGMVDQGSERVLRKDSAAASCCTCS